MIVDEKMKINIIRRENSKIEEIDFNNLKFGKDFSDHMFSMDYIDGKWQNPEIGPYQHITMSPASSVLHYGQAIFEGMKCYNGDEGCIYLFRPEENIKRMNVSAERLCMPQIPTTLFKEALCELVKIDRNWIPKVKNGALYIRPVMFATDEYVGVKPSNNYKFIIFCCPVAAYYGEPVKVKIETVYSRACEGGIGRAKAAGNYAAALFPAKKAQEEGYHQLIWTDAKEHRFVEESGTMNVMFIIDGKLMTPPTSGTILPGITRMSILQIARDWGVDVEETSISVDELVSALEQGRLSDAFGVGTAATIAQIKTIGFKGHNYELPSIEKRDFSNKVYQYLEDLKRGRINDPYHWNYKVS